MFKFKDSKRNDRRSLTIPPQLNVAPVNRPLLVVRPPPPPPPVRFADQDITVQRLGSYASGNSYTKILPDEKYDTKTIWGSDIVKYAVNQTNDFLALEDLLSQTGYLFICKNTKMNSTEFENVVRNENGGILFYCQETENWSSSGWSIFECSTLEFGFRIFNINFREVLAVSGRQCCYNQGFMEIKCGSYHLGLIYQTSQDGRDYNIKEPNGQVLVSLKKDPGKGRDVYTLYGSYSSSVKLGEIRPTWPQEYSIPRQYPIWYGIGIDMDLPTHQKHLIFGSSFLLFYQKYRRWNNRRRCVYALALKLVFLLIMLTVISIVVIYYYK